MNYLIIIVISYLFGSIPTAYLLVKYKYNKDIRKEGSGNVGTLNSFEVTNSKLIGAITLLVDLLKGLLPVLIARWFEPGNFSLSMTAVIFAVLGHCFNPWLKFKGGRGLATAAGSVILFSPALLIIWALLWLIAYVFKKNVHFANISAIVLTLALAIDSAKFFNKFTFPASDTLLNFQIGTSILLIILLIRHWEPLKSLFKTNKEKIRNKDAKF